MQSDHPSPSIEFVSFGGAVLDEIRIGDRVIAQDSLGGAGTHAVLGARFFLPQGSKIAWLLHTGADFPPEVETRLREWGIQLDLRRLPGVRSTRNVLTYHDHALGEKTFEYRTPVISMSPKDAEGTNILSAKGFHFHVHPNVLGQQIRDLLTLREPEHSDRPIIIWEPTRPSCTAANLPACLKLARVVDVLSPNHDELAALYNKTFSRFRKQDFEALANNFVQSGIGHANKGIIVVRAGEHGSLIQSRTLGLMWVPPFYESGGELINPKVIDTTGAGNSFLGGFAVGLLISGDAVIAAHYGSVAASYMVEQRGLPNVRLRDGVEMWNGTRVGERLRGLQTRLCTSTGQT